MKRARSMRGRLGIAVMGLAMMGLAMMGLAMMGIFIGSASPASAHGARVCVEQGDDYACHSGSGYNKGLMVCDLESDWNSVYVEYKTSNGHFWLYDGNGSNSGCDVTANVSGALYEFRVCENDWGSNTCSAWKDH